MKDALAWVTSAQAALDGPRLGAMAIEVATLIILTVALAGLIKLIVRARQPKEHPALAHPNRRLLHDTIVAVPGATFRELLRETQLSAGTARHHLSRLKDAELIREFHHKSTLRFFDNDSRYDDSWNTIVILREPDLQQLHEWLLNNPDAYQRQILDTAELWQWSRSTTQHRLKRLVEAGIVEVRQDGRLKSYRARQQAPPMAQAA